jgi:GntR family transcriptional regulator, transcriptional repressor for pyruvate dehydrogenase complex
MKHEKKDGNGAAERVLAWIQRHIEKEKLKPGDSLPRELDIAAAAGAGRSSVREALTALKVLGIITSKKKGGIRIVREPVLLEIREYLTDRYSSEERYRGAMEFRSVLERGLAELVFSRITRKDVAALRGILNELAKSPRGKSDLAAAEVRFHTILTRASGNHLAAMLSHIYTPVFGTAQDLHQHPQYAEKEWIRDHLGIVESLEKKDRGSFLSHLFTHTKSYLEKNG